MTKNSWSVYGLIVFGILLADQLSKYLVMTRLTLGTAIDVIPHFFRIISVRNTGIVFGLFSHNSAQSHQSVFIVFTLLAIGAIVFYSYRKIRSGSPDFYPLALILGGGHREPCRPLYSREGRGFSGFLYQELPLACFQYRRLRNRCRRLVAPPVSMV